MDMKRRLPEWMLRKPAADHGKKKSETQDFSNGENAEEVVVKKKSKTKDVKDGQVKKKSKVKYVKCGENVDGNEVQNETRSEDLNNCNSAAELKFRSRGTGAKHRRAKCDTEDMNEESCLLVKCEATKRSKRKTRNQSGVAKSIDAVEPPLRRQKTKAKSSAIKITDENEGLPQIVDNEDFSAENLTSTAEEYASEDEDLTIDDLLTIAKECVNEEHGAEQNVLSTKENKVGNQLPATDVSTGSVIIKGKCESIGTEEASSSEALHKQNITGSLSQDMLDLFLGPLLKKTQEMKDVELVRDDKEFSNDYNLKIPNRRDDFEDHPAPLAKKKGSLKDKVAMFFD